MDDSPAGAQILEEGDEAVLYFTCVCHPANPVAQILQLSMIWGSSRFAYDRRRHRYKRYIKREAFLKSALQVPQKDHRTADPHCIILSGLACQDIHHLLGVLG
jgi:hypothetical protein